MGTNDVDNGRKSKEGFKLGKFADDYRDLLLSIQAHIKSIHIICCGLVPRLVDYGETKAILNTVNKKIRKLCDEVNASYTQVTSAFCWCGIPQEPYYKPDHLHLSRCGALVLKRSIEKYVGDHKKARDQH